MFYDSTMNVFQFSINHHASSMFGRENTSTQTIQLCSWWW